MVFLTAFLVHLVKDNKRLMEQKQGYLYLISEVVIIFINKFYLHSISVLLIVASVVSWRFLRQISLHRGIRSGDFLLTVAVVWVVSLAACGVLVWSVLFPKKSAFAVFQSPSIPVAEWARKNTSKESVFLIPIYSEGGWAAFSPSFTAECVCALQRRKRSDLCALLRGRVAGARKGVRTPRDFGN